MTRPVEVPALWAVRSKLPGDGADYRVISSGPGNADLHLNGLLVASQPGSPTTTRPDRPGSLPWVTIGAHGEDTRFVSIAETRWTDDVDRGRRAIARTDAVVVDYDDIAGRAVSYGSLRAALARSVFPPSGEALMLRVEPDDAGGRRPPVGWALGVAALLLESRVVVTGSRDVGADDRVGAIDAVADLLPYGLRAGLSAATWVTAPGQRPHRLCFADHGDHGLVEVRAEGTPPEPRTSAARRYVRLVTEALDRGRRVSEIAAFLTSWSEPCTFESAPDVAADAVADFEIERVVIIDLRSGRARPVDALRALLRGGQKLFPEPYREDVLALALRARPGAADLERLADDWTPQHATVVSDAVAHEDEPRQRDQVLEAFAVAADRHGTTEHLLVALVERAPVAEVVALVRHRILVGDPPPWDRLRETLLASPTTAVAVAVRTGTTPDAARLLAWLGEAPRSRPAWLAVLLGLFESARERGPVDLEQARSEHPDLAVVALLIAVGSGVLGRLPIGLWPDVLLRVAEGGDRSREVVDLVKRARPRSDDASAVLAHLDMLTHLAGLGLLPRSEPPADAAAYVRSIADDAALVGSVAGVRAQDAQDSILSSRVGGLRSPHPRVDVLAEVLTEPRTAGARWVADLLGTLRRSHPSDLLRAVDERGGTVGVRDAPEVVRQVALARLTTSALPDPLSRRRWISEVVAVELATRATSESPSWVAALGRNATTWSAPDFATLCDGVVDELVMHQRVNFAKAMEWFDGAVLQGMKLRGIGRVADLDAARVQALKDRARRHQESADSHRLEAGELERQIQELTAQREKVTDWGQREGARAAAVTGRLEGTHRPEHRLPTALPATPPAEPVAPEPSPAPAESSLPGGFYYHGENRQAPFGPGANRQAGAGVEPSAAAPKPRGGPGFWKKLLGGDPT